MDGFHDDERASAYQRYIFNEFANIVHNYDRTARPDHDDIVYDHHDLDHLDGAEYDDNGDPVIQYGLVFLIFTASDDTPADDDDKCSDHGIFRTDDDCSFDDFDPEAFAARFFEFCSETDDDHSVPDNFYRLPLYDPRRGPCKRPYGFFYTSRDFPRPPA